MSGARTSPATAGEGAAASAATGAAICLRAGDALVLGFTNLNEVGCNGCRLKAISLRQIVGLS